MDLKLIETGSGGDLVFEGGDIRLTSEVYNQPYLARFGGNPEGSSDDQWDETEERGDWWGNILLLSGNENQHFNSRFERALREVPLSSGGRIKLERIAAADLNYLTGFADRTSSVEITSVDRIKLTDQVTMGTNRKFSYIWDEAKDEILPE